MKGEERGINETENVDERSLIMVGLGCRKLIGLYLYKLPFLREIRFVPN